VSVPSIELPAVPHVAPAEAPALAELEADDPAQVIPAAPHVEIAEPSPSIELPVESAPAAQEIEPALVALVAEEAPKPKRASRLKAARPDSVSEWFNLRMTHRPGLEMLIRDAYEAYCRWCEANGEEAVSNKRFGTILKDDFGIGTGRKNAGRFYVGLAAKPAALKLVSND
jgi:hypothetical protein